VVAAARVGCHGDIPRDGVWGAPDRPPPLADGRDGKLRSVMINADAYPPFLASNIVDAVWNCLTELGIDEVVNENPDWISNRLPFASVVLEVTDQFLLLCVDRDDRIATYEKRRRLRIDVLELCVPIDVLFPFVHLGVGMQAVAKVPESVPNRTWRNLVPHPIQFGSELSSALAGPAESRLWVAPRERLHPSAEAARQ